MKIAILTQPLGLNYGGIMQAWALQQVLKKYGHEPITIDRQADIQNVIIRSARLVYRALKNIFSSNNKRILSRQELSKVKTNTNSFIRSQIAMSSPIYSTEMMRTHFSLMNYEAVIVGSDQTWRPMYSPNIFNFYLNFLQQKNIKKLAYASSFGVDTWEYTKQQTRACSKLAKKFDFISVREKSGVVMCKENLGVSADHVLDPTLLLTANDYKKLLKLNDQETGESNGIYTYILDKTQAKSDFINLLEKKIGMTSYSHQAEESHEYWTQGTIDKCIIPPVTNWLSGFKNSRFVVTDSFHGMVFSIVFGKPFFVFANSSRGASRFKSLLDQLGLGNRLLSDEYSLENIDLKLNQINNYTEELSILRESSLEKLLMNLK